MRRFLIDPGRIEGGRAWLTGNEARHAIKVLRIGPGRPVELVDPAGRVYRARVTRCTDRELELEIVSHLDDPAEPSLDLHLGLAWLKADKMDQVVRKTTELGLTRLTPLFTARSEVRPDQRRIDDRLERWRRVSRQAVKQCRRGRPVDVRLPSSGSDFFKQARADVKVVCQAGGSENRPWADAFPAGRPESVVLLVGPEGGWAPDEVQSAREAGFLSLGLGPRVLRAETAALTAVVLALHRWGDIA